MAFWALLPEDERSPGRLGAAIAALQLFLPRFGALFKDAVGGNAESILDVEELAELIEQGQSKTGIATQLDLYPGKGRLQTGH